jgi:hypothetical protein
MASSSGHHHRPPRARKVYGKTGGPTPAGKAEHAYQQMRGYGACSCGAWTHTGTEMSTVLLHREHLRKVRQQAKAEAEQAALPKAARRRLAQRRRRRQRRAWR